MIPLPIPLALVSTLAPSGPADGAVTAADLAALERVEADAVGYAGEEGAFFALSRRLLAEGDRDCWERLAGDERPVVRALGLHVLARGLGPAALPRLDAALADDAAITIFPGGCVGWTATVSAFARSLVRDAHHLEMGAEPRPLVPESDLQALDLALLARNECAALHDEAARSLRTALARGEPALDEAAWARVAPALGRVDFVRGVGRIAPCAARSAFLARCLDDPGAEPSVRRAAASALARDPTDEAATLLAAAGPRLRAEGGEGAAARIEADFAAARAHASRAAPLRRIRTAAELEERRAEVRRMWAEPHPCARDDLEGGLSKTLFRADDVARRTLLESLERMAAHAGERGVAWDTWSDLPARLRFLVARERRSEGAARRLDESVCRRIEAALAGDVPEGEGPGG